jgi:hypothetical protein
VELLVGGVEVVVGQTEAHEDHRCVETLLQGGGNGDRVPFPGEDRGGAEAAFVGAHCRLNLGDVEIHQGGGRVLERLERDFNTWLGTCTPPP